MMRTSETGKRPDMSGFTLTEMLVVMLIVGLLGAAVLVAAPALGPSLEREAETFAARLVRAKEEAILTNRTIEVRISAASYEFGTTRGGRHETLAGKPFGAVAWSADTTAMLSAADGGTRISFDPTGYATPSHIDLFRSHGRVRVAVDEAGNVRIDASAR
jgi:general secretion pathway protein H